MQLGKKAIELVRKFAPAIAAGLGGPVAGQAAQFALSKLGAPATSTSAELESLILGATPQQLADLKKSDQEFDKVMRELDIDVFALEVDDRKDARQLFKVNMWPQIILSAFFIVGYFGLVYMLFKGHIQLNDSIRDIANVLVGVMTAGVVKILDFWFGSSHGSKSKNTF